MTNFTNHYNNEMGKCFVVVVDTSEFESSLRNPP
jgi:hypothetical protein